MSGKEERRWELRKGGKEGGGRGKKGEVSKVYMVQTSIYTAL